MQIVRALLATFLIAGATGVAAQPAPPRSRMLPMPVAAAVSSDDLNVRSAVYCVTVRDFCLRAWRATDEQGWTLNLHHRLPAGADVAPVARIAVPASDEPARETMTVWPHVIVEPSGARLFGVLRTRTTGFSGGGASATELILFRQQPGATEASEVLTVQTSYGAMIRACFSEEEYRSRGACHDEYEYAGGITLAPGTVAGPPRLTYRTAARSFPRGARADSETRRLRRSDLVWEADQACSYRRIFGFDAASGRYEPDRPLPDCSTYQLP